MAHPGAREQDSTHLSIRQLGQGPRREGCEPKKFQRALCREPVRGRGRIVQTYARMSPRLNDFGDGEGGRVAGLQVRSDQPDAGFKDLQRHSRLDPRPLDAPANGYTVVAVQSSQQSGLTGSVAPVNGPALALADLQGDVFKGDVVIQIHGRVLETQQRAAGPGWPAGCADELLRRPVVLVVKPALQSGGAESASIDDLPVFQHEGVSHALRDILDAMSRQDPGQRRTPCMPQPTQRAAAVHLIQAIQQFVQ